MRKNLQVRYSLLKELAVNLSSLGIPLSFSAGFFFGNGKWHFGLLILLLYLIIDNISGRLWFKIMEKMHE